MRDHNNEYQDNTARQYAYDFDYVIRRYTMRTLSPFFAKGKALELGCFEGEATKLLVEHFDDLTVLEAADSLIEVAKKKVPASVRFIHSTIETAELEPIYDAIFLVHTLEHLDDPVAALARIRQWLSPTGRLFVVVPNADAASRQIAVKMGLIETNNAVTAGELAHGHRCTYSLDTLEHDARRAGLQIASRGGVFFKPLANFQFDLALKHQVIDQGYLDGCYALGMQYPELSASIYLVCTKD
ncbi:class I SAM-dependent methyltransferase [Paraherbaspirillum soli]|uniref:Class I SAM-dependent methyltransferase n=1 Tax=Paraherbaspirillum soli TaxID=631222 RepID=A0ABW0MGC5_9BURK